MDQLRSCKPLWIFFLVWAAGQTNAQGFNTPRNVAEINNGQTTEAMPVVFISIDSVPSGHLAVKKNLTSARAFRCKAGTNFFDISQMRFLAFLIVVHQNRCCFWNP